MCIPVFVVIYRFQISSWETICVIFFETMLTYKIMEKDLMLETFTVNQTLLALVFSSGFLVVVSTADLLTIFNERMYKLNAVGESRV